MLHENTHQEELLQQSCQVIWLNNFFMDFPQKTSFFGLKNTFLEENFREILWMKLQLKAYGGSLPGGTFRALI